jgi:hypothetical protein
MNCFKSNTYLHILPAPLYAVTIALAPLLCPFQKRLWLLVQTSLHKKFNLIIGSKFFPSWSLFEWTEQVKTAWRQVRTIDGVWQYPPVHFLWCSCCGGDRRFWRMDLVLNERSVRSCVVLSLRMFSTQVRTVLRLSWHCAAQEPKEPLLRCWQKAGRHAAIRYNGCRYPLPNNQWNGFVLFGNICTWEMKSGLYLNSPRPYTNSWKSWETVGRVANQRIPFYATRGPG